jgi:hypothetical protein
MSDETRTPATIDVSIDKETRLVLLDIKEDAKQVRLMIPVETAQDLGRALRNAAHKMGRAKGEAK